MVLAVTSFSSAGLLASHMLIRQPLFSLELQQLVGGMMADMLEMIGMARLGEL